MPLRMLVVVVILLLLLLLIVASLRALMQESAVKVLAVTLLVVFTDLGLLAQVSLFLLLWRLLLLLLLLILRFKVMRVLTLACRSERTTRAVPTFSISLHFKFCLNIIL